MNGRKRHILVDTLGLLLKIVVHPANIADRDGGKLVLHELKPHFPRLSHVWVDAGYQGDFTAWVQQHLGWTVQIVKRPSRWIRCPADQDPPPIPSGFQVLPRRWVVERTFAWLGRKRRLSPDYEGLPQTSECWAYLAMTRLMVRRLALSWTLHIRLNNRASR